MRPNIHNSSIIVQGDCDAITVKQLVSSSILVKDIAPHTLAELNYGAGVCRLSETIASGRAFRSANTENDTQKSYMRL